MGEIRKVRSRVEQVANRSIPVHVAARSERIQPDREDRGDLPFHSHGAADVLDPSHREPHVVNVGSIRQLEVGIGRVTVRQEVVGGIPVRALLPDNAFEVFL